MQRAIIVDANIPEDVLSNINDDSSVNAVKSTPAQTIDDILNFKKQRQIRRKFINVRK